MNTIENMELENKRVCLRCDLNVTIKDGKILSDEKIVASLETIKYLLEKGAKVTIMSHLGKVKTEEDKKDNTLYPVYQRLNELLDTNVYFCEDTHGEKLINAVNELHPGEVLLMENTRFEDVPDKKESSNDLELAETWAHLFDIFVNDAFGTSHRAHASNAGIANFLPSYTGFLMQKELDGLAPLINPEPPFVVIMGGAKVTDKIKLIESILEKCDYLLVGGGIANTFLSINNQVGESLISEDCLEEVADLLKRYPDKIILPEDVIVEPGEKRLIDEVSDSDTIYDIGSKTVNLYRKYIDMAKTIFINGTVGMYEDARYENGTKEILKICSKAPGKVILGGGDALASSEHFKITDFYFSSTGGGATLDYIGSEKLKCMEK